MPSKGLVLLGLGIGLSMLVCVYYYGMLYFKKKELEMLEEHNKKETGECDD